MPELRLVNVAVVAAVAVIPLNVPPVITALPELRLVDTNVVAPMLVILAPVPL